MNYLFSTRIHLRQLVVFFIILGIPLSCQKNVEQKETLTHFFIPKDVIAVVQGEKIDEYIEALSGNALTNEFKDLNSINTIIKTASFFKYLDLQNNATIFLTAEGKQEFVFSTVTEIDEKKLPTESKETLSYDGGIIDAYRLENTQFFCTNLYNKQITSTSKLVIESVIRNRDKEQVSHEQLREMMAGSSGNQLSLYIPEDGTALRKTLFQENISLTNDKSPNWYQLDLNFDSDDFELHGIVSTRDDNNLSTLNPVEHYSLSVTPVTIDQYKSISFENSQQFWEALGIPVERSSKLKYEKSLIEISDEISLFKSKDKKVYMHHIKDDYEVETVLDSLAIKDLSYRGVDIYKLKTTFRPKSIPTFKPNVSLQYALVLGELLIFVDKTSTAEYLIVNSQNGSVISEQAWFIDAKESLNEESHFLEIQSIGALSDGLKLTDANQRVVKTLIDGNYKFSILQKVFEDDFAHVNFLIPDTSSTRPSVVQTGSFRSEHGIIAGPFLFPNHTNGRMDIVFQDETFRLHLLNSQGELQWSKQLDGSLLGGINAVDAYRNGRKQMVFSTIESIYFLDRKGRDLNKFPIKINGGITQPLSVFDYDKSRKYRFLATSNEKLLMYDFRGERVNGFKYQGKEIITSSPKHHRNGTLDYIIFNTQNTGVKALNRVGKIRTDIKDSPKLKSSLQFSKNLVIGLNARGDLFQIDLNTGITNITEKTEGSEYRLLGNTKILLSSERMQINDTAFELDYGEYSGLYCKSIKKQILTGIINESNKEVSVFDSQANLLPGFPIYGEGYLDLGFGKQHYAVTRDDKDILIYQW